MDPKRLEGVVPKQAVCRHCGYQFGGSAITGGRIRCSECGKETDFIAPLLATGETSEPEPTWPLVRRLLGLLIVVIVITTIVVVRLL